MTKPENMTGNQKTQSAAGSVRYDIERMNTALRAERCTMPEGLSREEKRQHIQASAAKK